MLNNQSSFDNYGTLDQQSDLEMGSFDDLSSFDNYGTLLKSGGVANNPGYGSRFDVGIINNSGTITDQVGNLTLGYPGFQVVNTGSIIGQVGTSVWLQGTLSSSGSIAGDLVAFLGAATVSGSFAATQSEIGSAVAMTGSVTE